MKVPDVRYFLKNSDVNNTSKTLISLYIKVKGKRIVVSTNERILAKHWDKSAYRPYLKHKDAKDDFVLEEELQHINHVLDTIEYKFKKLFNRYLDNENIPNVKQIKSDLKKEINPQDETTDTNLISFIQDFIDNSQNKPVTKKGYTTTMNHLINFQNKQNIVLTFDSVDLDFYNDIVEYFNKKGYARNTIGNHIKNLKVFMNYAYDKGLTKNDAHRKKRFVKLVEETDHVYLTEDELSVIYNHDFSKKPKLDRVRDLFIVGCYTGLRFGDLKRLSTDNITKDGNIRITTSKTNERVVIPLHWRVREILKKYNNSLPEAISSQKFNDYLKVVVKEAGIEELISVSKTKGGLLVSKTIPKYQLVSSHTARRTFATNAYLADVPAISIMKITSHKSEKDFLKYIKISEEDNARKLAQHAFFNPSKNLKKVD